MYNIGLIKYLYQHGYRQKVICLITGYSQSYVSKMKANPRPFLPTIDTANEEQLRRKLVIDRILELHTLRKDNAQSNFEEADKLYVLLLDFCLVDRDTIRRLYYSTSAYKISKALSLNKRLILNFQPHWLGIEEEDWAVFKAEIEKYFE